MGTMGRTMIAALALVLAAAADDVADAPGVTVNLNGATVLHRTPVSYPGATRQNGIQGMVTLEAALDAKGNVVDVRVLTGPAELRRPALESVLQWHFAQDAADTLRQISIQFDLPPRELRAARGPDFFPAVAVAARAPAGPLDRRIQAIEIVGLSADARNQLLARLPAHAGDVLTADLAERTARAVGDFDEHLQMGFTNVTNPDVTIQIRTPGYNRDTPVITAPGSGRMRVAPAVQQAKLKSAPPPLYPAQALQARIQGVVKLNATIGKDGAVQNLSLISGHPLLVQPAVDAVKQWVYEPTFVNGAPMEVETTIDVPFSMPPQ